MNIDIPNINELIERFLDGKTTNDEERSLFLYFAPGSEVAPGLEQYRKMFQWYASLGSSESEPTVEDGEGSHPHFVLKAWHWVSIAALFALLFTAGYFLRPMISGDTDIPEEYLAYEGSYIVRDGKKITDLRIVVPEILACEKLYAEQEAEIEKTMQDMDAQWEAIMNESSGKSEN